MCRQNHLVEPALRVTIRASCTATPIVEDWNGRRQTSLRHAHGLGWFTAVRVPEVDATHRRYRYGWCNEKAIRVGWACG